MAIEEIKVLLQHFLSVNPIFVVFCGPKQTLQNFFRRLRSCCLCFFKSTKWKHAYLLLPLMRESNRNLDIPPPGIPGEFACLVFEEGGNLTFFSSGRWGICLGGREFEFFF